MIRCILFICLVAVVLYTVDCQNCSSTEPIKSVDPPVDAGYCKEETDVCPSIFLSIEQIHFELSKTKRNNISLVAVNIGANDGIRADPIYPLLKKHRHFSVVQIEPSSKHFPLLKENMKGFSNVKILNKGVSPSTVVEICKVFMLKKDKTMDVLKIDIDGCECHLLDVLLKDSYYHAKIIQIELNHHIPPPIAYKDMCAGDVPGRSTTSQMDIWGCSMQAAYDVVKPYGYELLQHDWPDAVFIHSSLRETFPCILGNTPGINFERNYWIGYWWAVEHYSRFPWHQSNLTFVAALPELATKSYLDPKGTIELFNTVYGSSWTKNPLWIEIKVGNTAASIRQANGSSFRSVHWYN